MTTINDDTPCARGCCWTPYGHSTVRDGFPAGSDRACRCHTPVPRPADTRTTFEKLMEGVE